MIAPLLKVAISAGYPAKPTVLNDVSLELEPGEIVGLVGRSGEGKSTLILAILGLLGLKGGFCHGEIEFQGRNLLRLNAEQMRQLRGRQIALVPQSPLSALNPRLRLGEQLKEAWKAHEPGGAPVWSALLESVSLPGTAEFLRLYPRNLSVGMAQRFLIAMSLMHRPALLLADEPTSALDAITQAEILALFQKLNRELGIGILYISHDLGSVGVLCRRVAILHEGAVIETGATEAVFREPRHAYTQKLIAAVPRLPFPLAIEGTAALADALRRA